MDFVTNACTVVTVIVRCLVSGYKGFSTVVMVTILGSNDFVLCNKDTSTLVTVTLLGNILL